MVRCRWSCWPSGSGHSAFTAIRVGPGVRTLRAAVLRAPGGDLDGIRLPFLSGFAVMGVRDRSRPMGDQHDAARADAMLRRPAVDPGIPRSGRALLTAPGTLLTPAGQDRPARHRDFLPADPGQTMATVDGAV